MTDRKPLRRPCLGSSVRDGAAAPAVPDPLEVIVMAWRLSGTYLENCTCIGVCPCSVSSFALPAHTERCRALLAFHVDSGEADGVGVEDLTVVIVGDAPQQMTDGNWRLGLIVDERATDEQAQLLASIFGGERGGPMELLAPLVGELAGIERAPIVYADDGRRHRVAVGDRVEIEVEDMAPEGSEETTRVVNVFHPANSTLTMSRPLRSRIDAFDLQFEGRAGSSAPFEWAA